jgi:hypothetical protein
MSYTPKRLQPVTTATVPPRAARKGGFLVGGTLHTMRLRYKWGMSHGVQTS